MVKMALTLLALEQEIKDLQDYLDHLGRDFQGVNENPVTRHLRDRLHLMDAHLRTVLTEWPHLGLDARR